MAAANLDMVPCSPTCAMERVGMRCVRRRCKSEGLESDSVCYGQYEQSYVAETKRPLSRVRLPSPGRKPFQSVNATDLQYFSGSLPNEWSAHPHRTAEMNNHCDMSSPHKRVNRRAHNYVNGCYGNGYSSHCSSPSCPRKYQNGLSYLQGSGDTEMHKDLINCNSNDSEENYLYEVELLRSKLHGLQQLRTAPDGKRIRQRSESEVSSATTSPPDLRFSHSTKEVKRARDLKSSLLRTSAVSQVERVAQDCVDEVDRNKLTSTKLKSEDAAVAALQPVGSNSKKVLENSAVADNKPKKVREYPGPHSLDGLRPSLFSHVPPFIHFSIHDQKGPVPPPAIQKHLKWNLSTITPLVVRRTVLNSGYRLVRKSNEWTGTWGKHMKSLNFKVLKEYQKINHFPGTFQIGRKDRLWRNLFRLITKYGKKEFGFIPRTYVLPQDSKLLRGAWERSNSREAWIVKPPASARGAGIKVIHRWGQIPKKRPLVVQKYIDRPYLINGCKFDLRLYILVTSIHPLRIYMYDDGLVRFASVKYSEDPASLADRYMHLTNYSINKLSSQYTHNEDESACKGHKWTVKALWKYLERYQIDVASIWERLVDLAIKTVISGESSINQLTRAHLNSRYCCYELFGLDVLLDQDMKPWLLEVNISPSLHSSSPLDLAVKGPMVRDLMNMAGHQVPCKLTPSQQEEVCRQFNRPDWHTLCMDKRLYTVALSAEERNKHILHQQANSREEYLPSILSDLTADDVRHLIQYEDELTQCGRFQKIFPTPYTYEYHQFFESPRYYNMMFDAWETKYSNSRQEGIHRLEELCQQKLHLQVPVPSARAKCCMSQPNSEAGMRAHAEVGNCNGSPSCEHMMGMTATKRMLMSSPTRSLFSPTSPTSPSVLCQWSSARIKLSAARLRSHKLLAHRARPSFCLSRFNRCKSAPSAQATTSSPTFMEPSNKDDTLTVVAPVVS